MATMEFELERGVLLGALHKAQGVVDKKSTANVLSNVLMTANEDGSLRVVGTDFDVVLQADITAQVLQPGTACVNAKGLFDVVKNADAQAVHVRALDNDWVEVTAGRSRFKLAGFNPADFPDVAVDREVQWFSVPRGVLKDIIDKTAFSVSDDETRMNLNGVFLRMSPSTEGDGGSGSQVDGEGTGQGAPMVRFTGVSTDGHRLSRVQIDAEAAGYDGQVHEAIVHKKGVHEVKRLLDGDNPMVDVAFGKGDILFRSGGTTFTVRQIEDRFPDYERVIPASSPIRIEVDRARLVGAIRRIAVLTSSKTYIIKMELSPGQLAFTTSNPDYGEGRDELDVEFDGEGVVIGFNYTYLLDVLNAIRGDKVIFELSDEYGPTVLTAPGEPGALFVVMPMRI